MFDFLSNPLTKGIKLIQIHEYSRAIEYFLGLMQNNIYSDEACVNIGKCYFKIGKIKEAKEYFHKALNHKPFQSIITAILEVTNWKMICSDKFYCSWAVFSPNCNKIAYTCARRDTNGDGQINSLDNCGIYLMDIESGKEQNLVLDDSNNVKPVFSPDGSKLAYLSSRGNYIYVLNLESGLETKLLDSSFKPKYHVFSPDGEKIIFSGWHTDVPNSGIYSVEIKTGKIEVLVSGLKENTFPSISPTGEKLVYCSWRRDTNKDGKIDFHDNSGVYLKYIHIGLEIVCVKDVYNSTFPKFSPDGNKIVYLSIRRDTNKDGKKDLLDNAGIYIMDLISKKEYRIAIDRFFNKFPVFTQDSKNIVFISNWQRPKRHDYEHADLFENKGIYIVDINTKNLRQVVSDKYYSSRDPAISPKGDKVAYVSWRKNSNRGLYLANLNGLPNVEELHHWIDMNLSDN